MLPFTASAPYCHKKGEVESVVAYLGRSVSDTAKRYHSIDLECLAVIWAVERWRHFLHGRHFLIKTDNSCVVCSLALQAKGTRWEVCAMVSSFRRF